MCGILTLGYAWNTDTWVHVECSTRTRTSVSITVLPTNPVQFTITVLPTNPVQFTITVLPTNPVQFSITVQPTNPVQFSIITDTTYKPCAVLCHLYYRQTQCSKCILTKNDQVRTIRQQQMLQRRYNRHPDKGDGSQYKQPTAVSVPAGL